MELIIDISPAFVVSLDHKEMMATKMSCMVDSLLLSANVALRDSFFISGPCTKRARNFTAMTIAEDNNARLKKIGPDSCPVCRHTSKEKPCLSPVSNNTSPV